MKKFSFFIVMIAFCGFNEAIGQWNTIGNNIFNTNSGNVGIGNSSPTTLLHVAKNITEPTITVQNLGGTGGATYTMTDNASGANWKFKATNTGGFKIRDHANGLDVLVIESNSAANRLYINSAGNVGIGTATPEAGFHVVESSPGFTGVFGTPISSWNSSTNVSIGDGNGWSGLNLGQSESNKGYIIWNYNYQPEDASLYIGASYPNPVILQPFGGRVGINCYPSAALHLSVTGFDSNSGMIITNTRTGGKSISINQGTNGQLNFKNAEFLFGDILVYMNFYAKNVKIGTGMAMNSAILDLWSTSKGFLMPRMTQAQIDAMPYTSNGLIVFCITDDKFYVYISTASDWKEILFGSGTIFPCSSSITINHVVVPGGAAPVDKTVTYGMVTNIPGEYSKCWITSNLGADHQATAKDDNTEASAGWYWQFNRVQGYKHDGATRTPNTAWITSINENSNWISANDPCTFELGSYWRLPTSTEWANVGAMGDWTYNWDRPWNSALKMHAAGALNYSNGSLYNRGSDGYYWSSSQGNSTRGWHLNFSNAGCGMVTNDKANGFSARCLRDI